MIPIAETMAQKINPNQIRNGYDNVAYRNLLNNQLSWCNSHKNAIIKQATKLYKIISGKTNNQALKNRCCNFTLLEQKCQEYSLSLTQTQQPILPNQIPPTQTNNFTQSR